MKILVSDIKKFKALYLKYFKIELSDEEARKKLPLLVRQMEIAYQPITKQQLEDLVVKDARKRDAKALAEVIYDVYQEDKNHHKSS